MDFSNFGATALSVAELHLRAWWRAWALALLALAAFCYSLALLIGAPRGFVPQDIVIAKGSSLPAVAQILSADHLIAHPRVFEFIVRLAGGAGKIQAGAYRFLAPEDAVTIALRLIAGESDIPDIRITFIEGESVRQMAAQVAAAFPLISASDFIAAAGPYEGSLFPDTYRFSPEASADDIVARLRNTFAAKLATIEPTIQGSGHSLSDVITMASIVQDEASDPTDQALIAGVLWNRLARNMPLQVDATFGYLEDKPEHAPTLSELAINSPYNTYKYPGLPPTPIGNPGLSALLAAASPTKSNYLYYLTGTDGITRFSANYAGQLANQRAYLK